MKKILMKFFDIEFKRGLNFQQPNLQSAVRGQIEHWVGPPFGLCNSFKPKTRFKHVSILLVPQIRPRSKAAVSWSNFFVDWQHRLTKNNRNPHSIKREYSRLYYNYNFTFIKIIINYKRQI